MSGFLQPPDPPEYGICPTCKCSIHESELRGDHCIECEADPETATCGCGATGEVNYDDGTERRYYCYSALSMCSP